jgi:hypothetical protein
MEMDGMKMDVSLRTCFDKLSMTEKFRFGHAFHFGHPCKGILYESHKETAITQL